jgi:hypothetical protein
MPGLLLLIEPGCSQLIWCEFLFVLLQYVINVRVGFKILIGFIGIFHFVQLYLHLSRGLMLVVLCSVLKKSSYNVLSKLQIGFGSFVCILRRGDYLSSLGFVNI